ncbi:MAG TPA: GMC family oxidoreductase N-terminal domain-containing protein, partial [Steroidobacteraceae bacterium]
RTGVEVEATPPQFGRRARSRIMNYDYIIVGAGSAGCILANRLTESGRHSVLLLEAGGTDGSLRFKVPIGFLYTYYNSDCNWMYYSQPEAALGGRTIYCPRGKVQGGSGSINALIYVRGQSRDFSDWVASGAAGWSFGDVLPYYKKLESHPLGDTEYHSSAGPIHISPMRSAAHPICAAFLEGCASLGYPRNDDFNGASLEGAGIYDINTRSGLRDSSSYAYLVPALRRTQLTVEHNAVAEKVLFDAHRRAIGVSFRQRGELRDVRAAKEVILSAGAVGTPQLLQLSGVADRVLLEKHGIPVVRHAAAVGRNLQDHLCVSYFFKANRKTLNDDYGTWLGKLRVGLQYLLSRKGPLSLSVNQAGGFFRGADGEPYPNIQLYFNPLSYAIPKGRVAALRPEPYSGFLLALSPCRPTSRGSIEIASNRADDAPLIRPNYLSTPKDIADVIQGSRLVRRLMQARALQAITIEEVKPGKRVTSDEEMLQYFREEAGSIYHLCGSCAMGSDPDASVVSNRLRVHGIERLRIVDASVFPNVTSANINAPTMMVAEKAAAMIREDANAP